MSSSIMVLMFVLVTGIGATARHRPPWSPQPATARAQSGHAPRTERWLVLRAMASGDERANPLLDSLRAAGILRQRVVRPVYGPRAYVRWWERVRAVLVLTAIVAGLGVGLAALVGITVLGAGFLLEQAIS